MQIKCLDPEKKIFEGCLYMGEATGHLTQILGTNVRFPYLWRLDTKFGFLAKVFRRCLSIVNSSWTPEHRDRRRSIDIQ